jgi:hypothetical protein
MALRVRSSAACGSGLRSRSQRAAWLQVRAAGHAAPSLHHPRARPPPPSARRRLQAPVLPRRPARAACQPRAISIDRRHHMELAWRRQQELDAQAPQDLELLNSGKVLEVRDLAHLEALQQSFESSVIVVCFYKRSCGTCKSTLRRCAARKHRRSPVSRGARGCAAPPLPLPGCADGRAGA